MHAAGPFASSKRAKQIVASAFPFALAPTKEQGTTHHCHRCF